MTDVARASRLIALLLHLQVRGQITCAQLGARLGTSQRTVQRDVQALVAAGVPVRTMRGPAGGYRLDGGYRTRLTGVGLEEAAALTFLGLPAPAGQLGLGDVLATAQSKLWASLTGEARERAVSSAGRFHLDPVRWYGTAEPVPHLTDLAAAVWADRRVRVDYVRDGVATSRELDPLGLVLAAGDWYLVALREGRQRSYRVSRVSAVEVLDAPARRPTGFALGEAWARSRRELEAEHALTEVTVRIDPAALPRLRRLVAVRGQERVPTTAVATVELVVPFESEAWARTALLGLGAAVEVLDPPHLRQAMAREVRRAAARYD